MPYYINAEMLGQEGTDRQARRMVEMLAERGYDVEYTSDMGLVNGTSPDPDAVPQGVWDDCLAVVANEDAEDEEMV